LVDEFVTHTPALQDINVAFEHMHNGTSIRSVVDLHGSSSPAVSK